MDFTLLLEKRPCFTGREKCYQFPGDEYEETRNTEKNRHLGCASS